MKSNLKKVSVKTLTLLLLLCGLIATILFTYKNYGTTFDERDMIALGKHTLSFYTSFGKDTSFLTLSAQPEFFLTHGSIFEVIRQVIVKIVDNSSIDTYHLILTFFAVFGFFFIFQIVYLLTKNIMVAAGSFLLLFMMPRFYGDIFTNSKDIMPAICLLGAIYFSCKYLLRDRSIVNILLIGVLFGFGINLRPVLVYGLGLFVALSFIQGIFDKKTKQYIKQVVILLGLCLITVFLTSPYLLQHPQQIFSTISASDKYPWTGPILFDGIMYKSQEIPWYYLLEWIVISTPVVTLLLFSWGSIKSLTTLKMKQFNYVNVYIFLLFWIPILLVIATKPIIYDAWRQFLFLSGPLILLAAIGFQSLITSKNKIIIVSGVLLLTLNIFVTGREMLLLHPYEYIYFNSLVGGLKAAHVKYETDYWGASFKETTEWIVSHKQQLNGTNTLLYIAPCLPFLATPYLSKDIVFDPAKATVFYCYTRWNQDQQLPGQIVHTISREGIPLNTITLKKTG